LKGFSTSKALGAVRGCAVALLFSSAFLPAFTGGVLSRFGTAQVSALLLCAGLATCAAYAAGGGELRRPPKPLMIAAAVFCIAIVIAMLRADHKLSACLTGTQWLGQLVMLLALVMLAGEGSLRHLLVAGLAGTALVVAAYSIHQYYVGLPALRDVLSSHPELKQQFPEALGQAFERRALLTRRAFGTFITPNSLGGLMLLGLPLCACSLWTAIKRRNRSATVLCLVTVIGVGFALFLSKSKGAWLSAIMASAVVGLVLLWRGPKAAKARFSVGLGALVIALAATVFLGAKGFPGAHQFAKSFQVRADFWRGAWELIRQHPLMGHGLDSFGDLYPSVKLARAHETLNAHNDFLQIWAEAGIAGLCGFLGIWIAAIAGLRFGQEEQANIRFPLDLSAATLVILGLGIVADGRYDILPFVVLWLPAVYGVWVAIRSSRAARIAAGAAIVAYLIHSTVDMNAYVPGVAQPAWAVAGAAVLFSGGARTEPTRFTRPGRVGIVIAALLVIALLAPFEVRSLVAAGRLEAAAVHWQGTGEPREAGTRAARESIYELEKVIETLPYHDGGYARLGAAYALLHERGEEFLGKRQTFDLAVAAYGKAIVLNPESSANYASLARLYAKGAQAVPSRWEEAADAWYEAVRRYPTDPRYRLYLARSLKEVGDVDEALIEYEKALQLEKIVGHEWLVLSEVERREALSLLESIPTR